jgi:hypothetical protein
LRTSLPVAIGYCGQSRTIQVSRPTWQRVWIWRDTSPKTYILSKLLLSARRALCSNLSGVGCQPSSGCRRQRSGIRLELPVGKEPHRLRGAEFYGQAGDVPCFLQLASAWPLSTGHWQALPQLGWHLQRILEGRIAGPSRENKRGSPTLCSVRHISPQNVPAVRCKCVRSRFVAPFRFIRNKKFGSVPTESC